MFTLFHPAALLALAGLLVPVAIHLWNRRPGREVAVGSLRWLAAGANRRLRNLKLEQFWLLLLRIALLAVLAVAVAGPAWRQQLPASRGVVLLSPEVLRLPALAALRPTIDSLRRHGYALRWLAQGFPRVPGAQWQAGPAPDSAALGKALDFAWARVQQATAAFPGQPLLVVTSAALRRLQGPHPPLPAVVSWQVVPDTTSNTWLQAANTRGLKADTLQLLLGRSTEAGTTFRSQRTPYQGQRGEQLQVPGLGLLRVQPGHEENEKQVLISAADIAQAAPAIAVGGPMTIRLYWTPAYEMEARTLRAGLRAAGLGLPVAPRVEVVATPPPAAASGWLFWLSDQPLPHAWRAAAAQGAQVWQQAAGPGAADTAQLAATVAEVSIFRRETKMPANFVTSQPIWTDEYGRPVLSRLRVGNGAIYHLSTRLHPAWSQLADSPELPAQLLTLLQPEAPDEAAAVLLSARTAEAERRLAAFDQRALDPAQLTSGPSAARAATGPPAATLRFTDLRPWLVLLAGLLLLLERLLAHRRNALAVTATAP